MTTDNAYAQSIRRTMRITEAQKRALAASLDTTTAESAPVLRTLPQAFHAPAAELSSLNASSAPNMAEALALRPGAMRANVFALNPHLRPQ